MSCGITAGVTFRITCFWSWLVMWKRNAYNRTPKNYWASRKRGPLEPVVLPEEPPQLGRRETSQYFQADLAYFNLGWHVPGVSHDDMAPVDAASVILGGGASSRLYKELREKEGLVYGVGAYAYTPSFPGLLTVSGNLCQRGRRPGSGSHRGVR